MSDLKLRGTWVAREIDPKTGLVVAEHWTKNIFTTYGLVALASNINQFYSLPQYLVLESLKTVPNSALSIGATSLVVNTRVDQAGDTQLVIGAGLGSQETVTFTGVTGSGPYTYTLSPACVNAHTTADPVVRAPQATDTMTNVASEQQYDAVNFPTQRLQSPGGYSPGAGQWTVQWYYPAGSANCFIALCGMADSITVGAGNLHNHFVLGFDHTSSANDLEIDGIITLTNV